MSPYTAVWVAIGVAFLGFEAYTLAHKREGTFTRTVQRATLRIRWVALGAWAAFSAWLGYHFWID